MKGHKLNQMAFTQGGLFTAKQAESCGYARSNHHYHIKAGNWTKEGWGIYRFSHIPVDEMTTYWRLLLWSRSAGGKSKPFKTSGMRKKASKMCRAKAPNMHEKDLPKKDFKGFEKPTAVFSHKTALGFYELSDVNPGKITMTVPKEFHKRSRPFKSLRIYKRDLPKKDVKQFKGLPVTTPIRTLLDLYEEGSLSDDFMEQAVKEALAKGFIRKYDLKKNPELARYAL